MIRPARSIATRSHTASTSLRMCDDSSTVCPRSWASRTHVRKTCSMSGSSPVVGSSSRSRSARLAKAATSRTFWRLPWLWARTFLSGVQLEAVDELVAVRRRRPSRGRCRGTAAPRRRSATATGSPRSARRRGARGSPARHATRRGRRSARSPESAGSAPAAARSWSTSPPRSVRGSRRPHPRSSPGQPVERRRPPVALRQVVSRNGSHDLSVVPTATSHTRDTRCRGRDHRPGPLRSGPPNVSGQTNVPAGLTCCRVAAGVQHRRALTNDGTVVAWGSDVHGQTNVPADSATPTRSPLDIDVVNVPRRPLSARGPRV